MPVFPKPTVAYTYNPDTQVEHLRAHKATRGIPAKSTTELLICTWNIANFGAQKRRAEDRQVIAEILSWFDICVVQECRENFGDLVDVQQRLGDRYALLMSDVAGNDERMVYVYDKKKVSLLEEVGEIAFPPSQNKYVKLPGVTALFGGFDRNPFIASFKLDDHLSATLVNVHLFYGSEKKADIERRALETAAVARWAAKRNESSFGFAREVIALGDFNMPKPAADGGNIVYDALTKQGLVTPPHSSEIGSSIASDNHYDQVAMFPGTTMNCFVQVGVFDYDAVIFPDLWQNHSEGVFKGYLRYYMSDHRPLWVQMRIQ